MRNSVLTDARTQDNSKKQGGAAAAAASISGTSTSAMTNKNIGYAIAEDLTQNTTVGETKLKHKTNIAQQERQERQAIATAECLTSYATPTGLTGVPQDMLLKLIQSGHLQLHTEEDGSGQQYISIPLTTNQPTTAQTLKSPKEPNTKAQRCKGNIETARDMRMKDMKSAQSPSKASTSNSNSSAAALAGLPIKQELE